MRTKAIGAKIDAAADRAKELTCEVRDGLRKNFLLSSLGAIGFGFFFGLLFAAKRFH